MRHIEHPHLLADGEMLFDDAAVLDGHFKSGELDELRTDRSMNFRECCFFHGFLCWVLFQSSRNFWRPIFVSGCLISCSMTLNGMVQMSAPIIAASTTCN